MQGRYVLIHQRRGQRNNSVAISAKDAFFAAERLIVKVDHDRIRITRPGLDYRGASHKVHDLASGWRQIAIVNDQLQNGRFYVIPDESDEDLLVIGLDHDGE